MQHATTSHSILRARESRFMLHLAGTVAFALVTVATLGNIFLL